MPGGRKARDLLSIHASELSSLPALLPPSFPTFDQTKRQPANRQRAQPTYTKCLVSMVARQILHANFILKNLNILKLI